MFVIITKQLQKAHLLISIASFLRQVGKYKGSPAFADDFHTRKLVGLTHGIYLVQQNKKKKKKINSIVHVE